MKSYVKQYQINLIVGVEIELENLNKIIVSGIYKYPEYDITDFSDDLFDIIINPFMNNSNVYLFGDFNINLMKDIIYPIIIFDKYRSHTQSVERHIRLVSQTSKTIVSHKERDARINVKLMHRKLFPKLSTKRDFFYFV